MANNGIANDVDMANSGVAPSENTQVKITIPYVPRAHKERAEWMKQEPRHSVGLFAVASRKAGKVPDLNDTRNRQLFERSELFLNFLEYDPSFVMTPELRRDSSIDHTFDAILRNPIFHFPDDFKERAQRIYDSWVDSNWGAGVEEEDSEDTDEDETSSPVTTSPSTGGQVTILPPPARHPIWGVRGIMHGVALSIRPTGRRSQVLDRRYRQKPANRYGHNGLVPGAWFPNQLVALFHGAHGSRQAGIHGDRQNGTYSIVISGKYHQLDRDDGDTIHYSGAGSEENTDPRQVKAGKQDPTLAASIQSQNPVRVLRAATNNKSSAYAPSEGIRYDGLYRVVRQESNLRNQKGGRYARYVLVRLPDQPDLQDIVRASPTRQQLADFARIKEDY